MAKKKAKSKYYYLIFEAETEDPELQSLFEFFCGLKKDPVEFADSDEFQSGYDKYCKMQVYPIFTDVICGEEGKKTLDWVALNKLKDHLGKVIDDYTGDHN